MGTILKVVALLGLPVLTACASTDYGSRFYPVALTTVPPECKGWIIPNTKWVREKDKVLHEGGTALQSYDSIRTPWKGRLPPYVHVFVAADADQQLRWVEFTPSRDAEVVIDFGPGSATAPAVEN